MEKKIFWMLFRIRIFPKTTDVTKNSYIFAHFKEQMGEKLQVRRFLKQFVWNYEEFDNYLIFFDRNFHVLGEKGEDFDPNP